MTTGTANNEVNSESETALTRETKGKTYVHSN